MNTCDAKVEYTFRGLATPPALYASPYSYGRGIQTGNVPVRLAVEPRTGIATHDFARPNFDRVTRLNIYLARLRESGEITPETAERAWQVWQQVAKAVRQGEDVLPVPDVAAGPAGNVLFFWDCSEHHFEVEIDPEGETSMFYRNRKTGKIWGEDLDQDDELSSEAWERLSLFL